MDSDIKHCATAIINDCPLRNRCYRFLRIPPKGEVVKFNDYKHWNNECIGFWEVKTQQEYRFDSKEEQDEIENDNRPY